MAGTPLELHPDRLLPADPGTRAIARRLYDHVRPSSSLMRMRIFVRVSVDAEFTNASLAGASAL